MPFDGRRTSLSRTFDAERLNALANHPDIRPTCGGDGKSFIDLGSFVANPDNHAAVWETGAFLFVLAAPKVYEVHAIVLPSGRGREAYRMAAHGIIYMTEAGAEQLWARVSPDHPGLRHFTIAAGFTFDRTEILDIGGVQTVYDLFRWDKPCLQR